MKDNKICYITSSSFSGSTLLSLILNAHPAIGTISEFDPMGNMARDPEFRCSCGAIIDSCPFFLQLRDALIDQGVPFEIRSMDMLLRLSRYRRLNSLLTAKLPFIQSSAFETIRDVFVDIIPCYRREKERIYARNASFMRSVLQMQKASVYLDADKDPHRMLFLNKRFDVKALYLFKNGIAGAYSYLKSARRRSVPRSIETASDRWFSEQLTVTRCLAQLGRRNYFHVSYTDLCQNPARVTQEICQFLEIDPVSLNNFAQTPHHVIGNAMRLGEFSEIRERTDWKDNMTESEIAGYRKVASRYLPRLRAIDPYLADQIWF